jgi:hypothetical protein
MPEVKLPKIEMPKVEAPRLGIPEGLRHMTTDDVARAMPEMRMPKVDLPRRIDLSKVELPKLDVQLPDKLELPAVEIRRRRSGRPWLLLAVLAAVAATAWMVMSSPAMSARVRDWLGGARRRADEWGAQMAGRSNGPHHPRAFPEAERAEVQPNPYADELPTEDTGMTDTARPLTQGIGTGSP